MLSLVRTSGLVLHRRRSEGVCLFPSLSQSLRFAAAFPSADPLPIYSMHKRAQPTMVGGVEAPPPIEPLLEGRASRRRFSKANTEGRSHFITRVMERLQKLKQLHKRRREGELTGSTEIMDGLDIDHLHPRVKLDLVRRIRIKERALKKSQNPSPLPRFYSPLFRKKYFFKEEDLVEFFTKGRGPGGQATNRRMQTCVVHHKPSGVIVRHSKWPSLWLNRRAARELVNLRLEKSILGEKSELGQKEKTMKRRKKSERRNRKLLLIRGKRAKALSTRLQNFRSILRCEEPFPRSLCRKLTSILIGGASPAQQSAAAQYTHCATSSENSVNGLRCLLNEKCHLWWPVIDALSSNGHEGCFMTLLQCLFPVVPSATQFDRLGMSMQSCSDERDAYQHLLACRTDPKVLANVRLAFGCWSEMCGIQKSESTVLSADGSEQTRVEWRRDEDTWRTTYTRWINDTGDMKEWMRTALPHIFVSLLQLGCKPEAAAVKRFFVKEVKRLEVGKGGIDAPATVATGNNAHLNAGVWARTGLALLNQATRELVLPPSPH
jgi:hypothetical protein